MHFNTCASVLIFQIPLDNYVKDYSEQALPVQDQSLLMSTNVDSSLSPCIEVIMCEGTLSSLFNLSMILSTFQSYGFFSAHICTGQ